MISSVPGWFSPKYCVLWHFYGSDVLGRWLFPFTDGGNIYSNWEATYQLVDSWKKATKANANTKCNNRNIYRFKFMHGGNTIFNLVTTYQLVIKNGCEAHVWTDLINFSAWSDLAKKTADFFLLFPRFWVISAPLQSVLAIAFPLYHAPSTAATIYNIASLCVETSLFF